MRKSFVTIQNGFALLAVLIVVLSASCSKVTAPDAPVVETKEKTILIYMAANNNLYPDAANNISRMLNGYIPEDDCNLLIYSIPLDLQNGTIKDSLPSLVRVSYDKSRNVQVDTVYKFPYQNSATKTAISRVLNVTKSLFPARSYGLVLWSHGTGWLPPLYTTQPHSSSDAIVSAYPSPSAFQKEVNRLRRYREKLYEGITPLKRSWPSPPGGVDPYAHMVKSFGFEKNTEMSIFDLRDALPDGMFFDFIAFDACLMGGIEILYELRQNCNYMIFSPAEILTDSFDYSKVIKDFFEADYEQATFDIYDYYNHKTGEFKSVTISLFKTDGVEAVARKAKEIFDAHRPEIQTLDLDLIQPYFRYDMHWFWDLNDFIKNLATASESAEFESMLNAICICKYTTGQIIDLVIDPARFSGISCYINSPIDDELDAYYIKYDWEKVANMIASTTESTSDDDDQ